MMLIKSNGGSGYVEDVVFENFIGHGNAYSLDIDQYWSPETTVAGDGVKLTNISFSVSTKSPIPLPPALSTWY